MPGLPAQGRTRGLAASDVVRGSGPVRVVDDPPELRLSDFSICAQVGAAVKASNILNSKTENETGSRLNSMLRITLAHSNRTAQQ